MPYEYGPYNKKSQKLNANCPDSEKTGSGPGSCGGSSEKDKMLSELQFKPMPKYSAPTVIKAESSDKSAAIYTHTDLDYGQ